MMAEKLAPQVYFESLSVSPKTDEKIKHGTFLERKIQKQTVNLTPLVNDHIAGWNISISNRKYIFNPGPFSIAMVDDPGV